MQKIRSSPCFHILGDPGTDSGGYAATASPTPASLLFWLFSSKNSILGDPGADSGAEDENQNGREKIRRPPVLIFVFGPTICSWVSEDAVFTGEQSKEKWSRRRRSRRGVAGAKVLLIGHFRVAARLSVKLFIWKLVLFAY